MRTITYGRLPQHPRSNVTLVCRDCENEYSCTRGDYFDRRPEECCVCPGCSNPLRLAERSVVYRDITPLAAERLR